MSASLFYRDLIIKFLSHEISDDELDLLKTWLDKDIKNRLEFDRENSLWQKSDIKTINECYLTDKAWLDISSQLKIGGNNNKNLIIIKRHTYKFLIAVASIAFLTTISGISLWLHDKKSYIKAPASTIISTREGEKAHLFFQIPP
jgi:hypothetical protein